MITDIMICPLCGAAVAREAHNLKCGNGHNFDISRQGHINLLPVNQKHSKNPGDTHEMVIARREFLNKGFYRPIADKIITMMSDRLPEHPVILDAGCGEGYYLSCVQQAIPGEYIGLDISKDAVRMAAGQNKNATWITASASAIPVKDSSLDCITSLFAYPSGAEFLRVLKPGGYYLEVTAGRGHLMELKKVIYPKIIDKQPKETHVYCGMNLVHQETLLFEIKLDDNESVLQLLSMTPHFWRITKEGAERAHACNSLRDIAEIDFSLYQKIEV